MKNALHPNFEAPDASLEIEAGVLFVDLDETFLDGTVTRMTDEELENANLISGVLSKIQQAKTMGIPVVMVTRNNHSLIERFFEAKPQTRSLFDEAIACEVGQKSSAIQSYLNKNGITSKKALFADDTAGERSDVSRNTKGVRAIHPNEADNIILKRVYIKTTEDLRKLSREKLIVLLKKTHDPNEREKVEEILKSDFFMEPNDINLAA
jgi:predicted enzyme involved in methoxymalonyl-ACP biosynthesis